jgi:hypothetical protein
LVRAWLAVDFSLGKKVGFHAKAHVPPLLVKSRTSALVLDVARPRLLADGEVRRLDVIQRALVDLLRLHELLVVGTHVVVDAAVYRLCPLFWRVLGKVVGVPLVHKQPEKERKRKKKGPNGGKKSVNITRVARRLNGSTLHKVSECFEHQGYGLAGGVLCCEVVQCVIA